MARFTTQRNQQTWGEFETRIQLSLVFVVLVVGMIVFRLWTLQFAGREEFLRLARSNYLRTITEPALRGRIYDRNGNALAENIPAYDLVVNWKGVNRETRKKSIRRISELLGVSAEQVGQELARIRPTPFQDRVLRVELDRQQVISFREARIPGVDVRVRPLRHYPYGKAACQLIGYMGEIDKDELERQEDYRMGEWIGKLGLEKHYEFHHKVLRGQDGYRQVQVYANGLIDSELPDGYRPSRPGRDIHTTLDIDLQLAAESILGPSDGAIVIMQPKTGDILAMVSHPGFDPNVFVRSSRKDERAEALSNRGLFNLALNGAYAPGSVFKGVVVATAALEEDAVNPTETIHCAGRIPVGGGYKHCHLWWNYRRGHGNVDMPEAIMRSCDVYFYKVAQRMGHEKIIRCARSIFGLITEPSLAYRAEDDEDLFSLVGENPDPGRVIKTRLMRGPSQWYLGDTLNLAIGQGEIAVTPLQTAVLMCVQATGGVLQQPRLVSRYTESDGTVVKEFEPKVIRRSEISPSTVEVVNQGLRWVMKRVRTNQGELRQGTAYESRVEGLDVLGKTGTAEKGTEETDAWFACFAPGDDPEIAIAIVVPNAGHGGDVAAPMAKQILEFYFADRLEAQLTKAES